MPLTPPFSGADNLDARLQNSTIDQFLEIQQQLRQLEVSYCRLETWGIEGRAYRFYCHVPDVVSPGGNRPFQATDKQPLRAMARVLAEVQAWRAGLRR